MRSWWVPNRKSSVRGSEWFLPLFPVHPYTESCDVGVSVISFYKEENNVGIARTGQQLSCLESHSSEELDKNPDLLDYSDFCYKSCFVDPQNYFL